MEKAFAPWTAEQIDTLNRYQTAGIFHEFTCHAGHTLYATEAGWRCRFCIWYEQDWAWTFMADRETLQAMLDKADGKTY